MKSILRFCKKQANKSQKPTHGFEADISKNLLKIQRPD